MYDGDDRTDASAQEARRSLRPSGGPTSVTISTRRALGLVTLSLALGCTEPPPTAAQGAAALEGGHQRLLRRRRLWARQPLLRRHVCRL